LILDPWQQEILRNALGERPDGTWSAFEVALIVSRQNGKGSVLEARELAGLLLFGERLILHSAHEMKTASEAFRRVRDLFTNNDDMRRRVAKVTLQRGDEGIELKSGARLRFVARSSGSGRGFTGDCVILDEAYAVTSDQIDAMLPTLSARPNPQVWYTSSPPLDGETGAQLFSLRERAEEGGSDLAYFDFGAAGNLSELDKVDLDDQGLWAAANPAYGIRISKRFVAAERQALTDQGFARERLGIWPVKDTGSYDPNVPTVEEWARLAQPDVPGGDLVALAVDITPSRDYASIVAVGDSEDGLPRVRILDHGPGVEWLLPRILQLHERLKPVCWVLDDKSGAGTLILPMERAGIERMPQETDDRDARKGPQRGQLWVPTPMQYGAACATFTDTVRQGGLIHSGQEALTVAIDGAKTRPMGDGAWGWGRKIASADISPLVAATLGLAGLQRWRHLAVKRIEVGAVNTTIQSTTGMFRPAGRLRL
jgi:phage terminase large subunit-like protein